MIELRRRRLRRPINDIFQRFADFENSVPLSVCNFSFKTNLRTRVRVVCELSSCEDYAVIWIVCTLYASKM